MAKPILYHALVRPSGYGAWGFRILGVTSEKGRQVYGRDEADAVTHVAEVDVLHRFPAGTPEEMVRDARNRAERARERLEPGVRHAEAESYRLRREMQAAILDAAKGEDL